MKTENQKPERSYKWTYYAVLALIGYWFFWQSGTKDHLEECRLLQKIAKDHMRVADSFMHLAQSENHYASIKTELAGAEYCYNAMSESAKEIERADSMVYYTFQSQDGRREVELASKIIDSWTLYTTR